MSERRSDEGGMWSVDVSPARNTTAQEQWHRVDRPEVGPPNVAAGLCTGRGRPVDLQRRGQSPDAAKTDDPATWGFGGPALRLGMRLVRGVSAAKVRGVEAARRAGPVTSIHQLARQPDVSRETLLRLASADAFRSLGLNRRDALWQILALDDAPLPLFAELEPSETPAALPSMPLDEAVVHDYDALGLSLSAHPIGLVRDVLQKLRVSANERLKTARQHQRIAVAGLVTHRQRPGTAKGIVFMTLEDETGQANLIFRPPVWDRYKSVARSKVALIVEGTIERQDAVVHVQVNRIHDLSARIAPIRAKSRDFH